VGVDLNGEVLLPKAKEVLFFGFFSCSIFENFVLKSTMRLLFSFLINELKLRSISLFSSNKFMLLFKSLMSLMLMPITSSS
jgi:hypothetical protein